LAVEANIPGVLLNSAKALGSRDVAIDEHDDAIGSAHGVASSKAV
jgi:hypothetical protein